MPRQREPADVFYATNDELKAAPTPEPETPPTKPTSPKQTPPKPTADTPPGPIRLELRINDRIALTQRLYHYTIDQQDDHLTITGNLRPTDDS